MNMSFHKLDQRQTGDIKAILEVSSMHKVSNQNTADASSTFKNYNRYIGQDKRKPRPTLRMVSDHDKAKYKDPNNDKNQDKDYDLNHDQESGQICQYFVHSNIYLLKGAGHIVDYFWQAI